VTRKHVSILKGRNDRLAHVCVMHSSQVLPHEMSMSIDLLSGQALITWDSASVLRTSESPGRGVLSCCSRCARWRRRVCVCVSSCRRASRRLACCASVRFIAFCAGQKAVGIEPEVLRRACTLRPLMLCSCKHMVLTQQQYVRGAPIEHLNLDANGTQLPIGRCPNRQRLGMHPSSMARKVIPNGSLSAGVPGLSAKGRKAAARAWRLIAGACGVAAYVPTQVWSSTCSPSPAQSTQGSRSRSQACSQL